MNRGYLSLSFFLLPEVKKLNTEWTVLQRILVDVRDRLFAVECRR